jgi:hypothetical protein
MVNNLTEEQKFAIYWCFNYAMKYVDKHSPIENLYGPTDVIVNGTNINETIKNILGERLFV